MRKSRFTETQIIGMIKEQEAGLTVADVCRKHGISPASFYKLKAKYGGMDVSDKCAVADVKGGKRTDAARNMKDRDMQKGSEVIRATEPPLSPATAFNKAEGLSGIEVL